MNAPSTELVLVPDTEQITIETGAPADKSLALFSPFKAPFAAASLLLAEESAAKDPASARTLRLKLVKARTLIANVKDAAKADVLIASRVIDWYHNKAKAKIAEAEERLESIEKEAARAEAARKAALKMERESALKPYGINTAFYLLSDMSEEVFAQLLESSKAAHEAKIAAAQKAEADRIEKEKADAEAKAAREQEAAAERERIRIENERLKREAAEREATAKAEREKAAAAIEKARREKAAIEAAAEKERAAAVAEAARIKAEADKAAKIAAEKAKAEKDAADARAKIERDAREKLEAEARAVREREAARHAAEAAEVARAAAAPDREKLAAFAALLRTLELPDMSTKSGKQASVAISALVEELAVAVEIYAQNLAQKEAA